MKKVVWLLIVLVPFLSISQNYNVLLIADSLKRNADAVIRYDAKEVFIKSTAKVVVKHKRAITILNEAGKGFSWYSGSYDKQNSINYIDGTLYDAMGNKIKSVKKKDIADKSDNEENLMTDNRTKYHNFHHIVYPYTVEYEDEIEIEGTFFLPRWMPIYRSGLSLEQSKFLVKAPSDYLLRYKTMNIDAKPKIIIDSKESIYEWQLANIAAMVYEPSQPDWESILPSVLLAPSTFELGDYKGDMTTWKGFGNFMSSLYAGRDKLPENIKQDIHRITDGIDDKNEKIKAVYHYLQKNTRYISVQLGIGGWQPFDAAYVATKKYGDCKALSNYMVSMLKEVGIKAHEVIIKSEEGSKGLWEDFPVAYFNHVVVCVPSAKDTLWLECTSPTTSPGYFGSSTCNRKAVMLGEDGGVVVSTPHYGVNDNLQIRKIDATVDLDGNLVVESKTHFTGIQQEHAHGLMYGATEEYRKKYLNNVIGLPTYTVQDSKYTEQKGKVPVVDEYLKITASNYASVTGKRLFIMPNLFSKSTEKFATDLPRKFDINIDISYRDVDTIFIKVPQGYIVESMPKNVSLQNKWGKYNINFLMRDDVLNVVRSEEKYADVYPSSDFMAYAKYADELFKADRSKVVFVKKD